MRFIGAAGVRAYGVIDDSGRCEALRQAAENDITDAEAISEAVMSPARWLMLSERNIAGSPRPFGRRPLPVVYKSRPEIGDAVGAWVDFCSESQAGVNLEFNPSAA